MNRGGYDMHTKNWYTPTPVVFLAQFKFYTKILKTSLDPPLDKGHVAAEGGAEADREDDLRLRHHQPWRPVHAAPQQEQCILQDCLRQPQPELRRRHGPNQQGKVQICTRLYLLPPTPPMLKKNAGFLPHFYLVLYWLKIMYLCRKNVGIIHYPNPCRYLFWQLIYIIFDN